MQARLRTIIGIVFLLTCIAVGGAVSLFKVRPVQHLPKVSPSPPLLSIVTRSPSFILSKLSLIPRWQHDRAIIAVMIENHEDARPHQRGLDGALLIEEFLVEGFISRFVALFDIENLPPSIGPIRSLRPYFLHGVLPWASALLYAGGSPEALEEAEKRDGLATFNALAFEPKYFSRDSSVSPPHNLFISDDDVHALLSEFSLEQTSWPPYELGGAPSASGASVIRLNFLNPLHNIRYTYSPFTGTYTRKNGTTTSDATPANILVLEMPVTDIGEFGRLTIPVEGAGRALLFRSGVTVRGGWQKESREHAFHFVGEDGGPLRFSRGQTWMAVLPELSRVNWEE